MVTVVRDDVCVQVPNWIVDLKSFRRWATSNQFPHERSIFYRKGEVCVDLCEEQVFTHTLVKTKFIVALGGLVETEQLGLFFGSGLLFNNSAADLSCKPDATFIATKTLRSGRVKLTRGIDEGYVEVQGSPDMVLEVVGSGSVRKDTVDLRNAYWKAGIREYWLVDARSEPLSFEIWRRTAERYVGPRKQSPWRKSAVFGKSFQLTRSTSALGHPEFTLAVR